GIAALEIYFADLEADYAAFVFTEELIFPPGRNSIDFERGAEAAAGFFERDGGEAGDGVVGETVFGVANDDLLLEEDAEPFGGVFVGGGEVESTRGDVAAIVGDGEGDGAEVGGIVGANEVDGGSALAVDPFAVDGVQGPGAVE